MEKVIFKDLLKSNLNYRKLHLKLLKERRWELRKRLKEAKTVVEANDIKYLITNVNEIIRIETQLERGIEELLALGTE